MTRSCIRSAFTKQIVRRTNRLIRVRKLMCYERSKRGLAPRKPKETRSGTSQRELWTQYGCIFDLRVPKLRRENRGLDWQSIERDERCWGPFLHQQLLHYTLGHSLRDLQEAMHVTLGEVLSLEACSAWSVSQQTTEFCPRLSLTAGCKPAEATLSIHCSAYSASHKKIAIGLTPQRP